MESWKTVKNSWTEMTGPAASIEALAKEMDEQGIEYTIEDYPQKEAPAKRKTRKTVANVELEVRENTLEEESNGSK